MSQKKTSTVKEPKRATKAIEELHHLVGQLRFFYQSNNKFKEGVLNRAIFIEEVLHELSIDKKIDHARFASKFKNIFGKENKELKKQVKELEQENRKLKDET